MSKIHIDKNWNIKLNNNYIGHIKTKNDLRLEVYFTDQKGISIEELILILNGIMETSKTYQEVTL